MRIHLRYFLITLLCMAFSFNANASDEKMKNSKLLNDSTPKTKALLARGGGRSGGSSRSGGSYSRGSSGRSYSRGSGSKSFSRSSGSRSYSRGSSSGKSYSRGSSRSGISSSGKKSTQLKSSGKTRSQKMSGKTSKSRSVKSGKKGSTSKKSLSKKSKSGKSGMKSKSGKTGKKSVGKKGKSGKKGVSRTKGKGGKGVSRGRGGKGKAGSRLGKSKRSDHRHNRMGHHRNYHHGHHGHHGDHYGHWNHWNHGWWAASACWGGVFFGLGALYPFWYPWGGYWGPYWAATWPWATGLYWYPRYSWWYWEPYDCWMYPFYGLGWGLVYANLGYYWYPKVEVSIYNEVPEQEDDPITYTYIENESKVPLYWAVYRKVEVGKTSYLIQASEPQVIKTRKIVKVYLPENASKDTEYVVVPRRDEDQLRNAMDEKGNEISSDILEQIREENEGVETTHEIEVSDLNKNEYRDLNETKMSARKDEKKIRKALENIDKEDKDKLPKEKDLPAVKEGEGPETEDVEA